MENHAFSGERPIEVIQFLSAFKTTCDDNDMPESASVRPISKYLTGAAKRQFDSYNALGASRLRGFSSCPEAVQHLLKSFAIEEAIIDVVAEFDGLKQNAKEEEWAFRLRVRHTARLCGNLFSENQLITSFIFGTHEDIKPIIVSSKA